jgi:transposase InsO family protein
MHHLIHWDGRHPFVKIPPLKRVEIWNHYSQRMKETKWKKKEKCYKDLALSYQVHINTIRRIIDRARGQDFTIHKSTRRDYLGHRFIAKHISYEKKLLRSLHRIAGIHRYEKEMAGEMVHIDVHKLKNIKWENPRKKKYLAGVIDDATRITYIEVIPNKRAKTLADFMRRAYKWYKQKGITIKRVLSDNWLEFTTHNQDKKSTTNQLHSFEALLIKLGIIHKYTKVRRPQTNGKIERFWRMINDYLWNKYTFTSHKDFNLKLRDWLVYYNLYRPHWWLNHLSPMQKLEKLLEEQKVCI